ncbi:Uncharacterized protein DAT39_000420, partial [Clarias magur]
MHFRTQERLPVSSLLHDERADLIRNWELWEFCLSGLEHGHAAHLTVGPRSSSRRPCSWR